MLLLTPNPVHAHSQNLGPVIIFGLGLIGLSIKQSLEAQGFSAPIDQYAPTWTEPKTVRQELNSFQNRVKLIVDEFPVKPIHVIWSAGSAGFGASKAELDLENNSFQAVVDFSKSLIENTACPIYFHLLSSAGGLFEGQICVDDSRSPKPVRPYGHAKLEQEKILKSVTGFKRSIYRPSSVYGFNALGTRQGLVLTLLKNALAGKITHIFGHPNTIRDYVFVEDIGQFVTRRILNLRHGGDPILLTSGKPTTLNEMVSSIQFRLNKTLYLQFVKSDENAQPISFSRRSWNKNWRPTSLEVGIEKTLLGIHQAMTQGSIFESSRR